MRQPAGMRLAVPSGSTIGGVPGAIIVRQYDPPGPSSGRAIGSATPGGCRKTLQWWTTALLPGRTSAARTHLSSVKPGSTTKYWYSTAPSAGTVNGSGIDTTRSGPGIDQPSGKARGGGRSRGLPSGQPESIQLLKIFFSL